MTPDEIISADTNLTLLEKAIENETPISFRYWKDEDLTKRPLGVEPARRVVSPYELKGGREEKMLLVCWDHGRDSVRFFDIDRIGGVRSEEGVEDFVFPVEA